MGCSCNQFLCRAAARGARARKPRRSTPTVAGVPLRKHAIARARAMVLMFSTYSFKGGSFGRSIGTGGVW
eukprot:1821688-Lingulodinium_polyedra.AAC.1